jgi:hypothetical protein
LSDNYPNPFNPSTKINFSITEFGRVTIVVYDLLGREIATLVNEERPAGNYNIEFISKDLASGVYVYRMQVYPSGIGGNNYSALKKMILLR